jgi:D-arabinose 1-dehydrogenase-like Zn-dependent alcohol dehydrogenase
VRPKIEKFALADAERAFGHMMENKARFRAVLVP